MRKGLAGFVGGYKNRIRGFFRTVYSASSVGAVIEPIGEGILSIAYIDGIGIDSMASSTGRGISSKMALGRGVYSVADTDSGGVDSETNTVGGGINSRQ